MTKTFFYIKQGGHSSLRALAGEDLRRVLIDPPSFFSPYLTKVPMEIKPAYKDVPFVQEKLKALQHLIKITRATIVTWEASGPNYSLLPQVKEQLKRQLKLWADVTEDQLCQ